MALAAFQSMPALAAGAHRLDLLSRSAPDHCFFTILALPNGINRVASPRSVETTA